MAWVLSRHFALDEASKNNVEGILAANELKSSQFTPDVQNCGTINKE